MSQCDRILEFLSDGREHEMRDIHRAVGFCRLNSRVAELRKRGHHIECRKTHREFFYTLLSEPDLGAGTQETVPASTRKDDAGSGSLSSEQLRLVA